MKADIFEVSYTGESGQQEVVEVAGHQPACIHARELAKKTGRRTVVRKQPPRNWHVIVADCETGEATRMETVLTGPEATILFQRFNKKAKSRQAIAVFWPTWAPDVKIIFERS